MGDMEPQARGGCPARSPRARLSPWGQRQKSPPQHPAARLHLGSGVFTARGHPQRNAMARMVSILGWRGVGVGFLGFFFPPLPLLVAV